jgi:hypothetical protein
MNVKNKKMFIAYGTNTNNPSTRFGIEVHLIYANDIEEAISLCPIPPEEVTIELIKHKKKSGVISICDYYE